MSKRTKIKWVVKPHIAGELIEGAFHVVPDIDGNIFDPAVIQVDAIIVRPDYNQTEQPCFWMQDHRTVVIGDGHEGYVAKGPGVWSFRHKIVRPGSYQIQLRVRGTAGKHLSKPRFVHVADLDPNVDPIVSNGGPK